MTSRSLRAVAKNAIFAEFGQCLAWAFIDPSSQARNAPIWAPGKKREMLPLCLSYSHLPPPSLSLSRARPRSRGKGPSPRNSQEGRLIYGGTSSLRSLQPNFVKLLALSDPLSVALSRVPFSPTGAADPLSSFLRSTLNPSRVRSRVLGVRNCGRVRVLTRGRPD